MVEILVSISGNEERFGCCATAKFSSRKGNIRERLAIFGHGSETEVHFWLKISHAFRTSTIA
jgi:hypothetical protein